jgi:23S rRNA (cytosine1962-C5)-methyltransferase
VSGIVTLRPGREKPLRNRHPWVFSGAIAHAEAEPGAVADVLDASGQFLARGYYNPHSQIRVRLLSWDENEIIDVDFWGGRLAQAVEGRAVLAAQPDLTAYRLIHAESDGLPGLIVDRYGDFLVLQALTLGIERIKPLLVECLAGLCTPLGIFERSDVDVREKEGLAETAGLLWGEEPPNPLEIREHGLRYLVDVHAGHKTGFYLDQRASRRWLLADAALAGKDVLNAFSYTGSFAVCAGARDASSIVNVDSSSEALAAARQNMALNGLDHIQAEYIEANVFGQLRAWREQGREFDVIILDPPKFAHSPRQVEKATRGYKDINLLAFQLLRPNGLLITFSCSGLVDADLFQKVVFGASVDAGREAQIVQRLSQPADHPVLLSFPEGQYLKGLVCRVW